MAIQFDLNALSQRLVIDLEPEIPVVTDYQLAQSMDI